MRWRNPVLPGFHPDPSVCRVGDCFYLATSSFHFFPGLPLWRSHNLVDWEPVGPALCRPSQLDLAGTPPSRGLYAPTLRHGAGRFWLACTEVDRLGNFLLSAPSIEGPWSDPLPLAVGGIDPSLFFDDDGTVYLCSNDAPDGRAGISLSVIDPGTGAILERPRHICAGSGGRWPEGPHLYRRGGAWYLLLSEGGTEYGHYASIFRSASPWGPWEACPRNPVLSHRDDAASPIQCVGHPDLVEDAAGRWWLLCLGVRPLGPMLHNLGRETFLAPVSWDGEGWPVMGQDGKLGLEMEGSLPGPPARGMHACWEDRFDGPGLGPEWISLRRREPEAVALEEGRGLVLRGAGCGLSDPCGAPALVARPQPEIRCSFEALLDFRPTDAGMEAGIAALHDEDYHYEAFVTCREGTRVVALRRHVHDLEVEGPVLVLPGQGRVLLRLDADEEFYRFSFSCKDGGGGGEWRELGAGRTAGLCAEGTWRMTFTGVHFGLYCRGGEARFRLASCMARRASP